jgi:hypothetical protein
MATNARVASGVVHEREAGARQELVVAGIAGGLAAGAAMLVFACACAALADLSATRPLELAAGLFVEGDPSDAGAGALLAGIATWLLVSVLLAFVYTAVAPRDLPFPSAAMVGAAYAWVVMAFATSWALPRWNPAMRDAMPEMGGAWVLAYTVFGVVLGVIPPLRRRLAAR